MAIYDKNNVLVTNLVESALSRPEVIAIKNRTLDGAWHVQGIGEAATVVWVKATLTLAQKEKLDQIKSLLEPIKIIFDGRYYIGIIDDELGYERTAYAEQPMFDTSFLVSVQSKGAV